MRRRRRERRENRAMPRGCRPAAGSSPAPRARAARPCLRPEPVALTRTDMVERARDDDVHSKAARFGRVRSLRPPPCSPRTDCSGRRSNASPSGNSLGARRPYTSEELVRRGCAARARRLRHSRERPAVRRGRAENVDLVGPRRRRQRIGNEGLSGEMKDDVRPREIDRRANGIGVAHIERKGISPLSRTPPHASTSTPRPRSAANK